MAQPKMRLPIRYADIELPAPFEGFTCKVKVSVKLGILSNISSGEFDKILAGLREIVVDWNFVDEEGRPLPKPNEPPRYAKDDKGNDTSEIEWDPYHELTLDLTQVIVRAFTEEVGKVPNG